MRHPHAFVRGTILLAIILLAVFALAAAWWYQCRRPDPMTLDQEGLFRWLVTSDLSEVPRQTRWLVAKRLENERFDDVDWEAISRQLTAAHRARLWANVPLILEPWFLDKVRRYHECEAADRMALLDRMIDTLSVWKGLDKLSPKSGPSDQRSASMKTSTPGNRRPASMKRLLLDEVAVWRSRAKPEQQGRIDELVAAVEIRWLFRQLTGTLDVPKPPRPDSGPRSK
jgi:hypothetical protein